MHTRQILAVDSISLSQTKEWLNMGHPCIITADPYMVISSMLYNLAQWGNGNHVSACQVRGTSLVGSSRRQIRGKLKVEQNVILRKKKPKHFYFSQV